MGIQSKNVTNNRSHRALTFGDLHSGDIFIHPEYECCQCIDCVYDSCDGTPEVNAVLLSDGTPIWCESELRVYKLNKEIVIEYEESDLIKWV